MLRHVGNICRPTLPRMAVIPDPALVWLIGPSGSGKSTWAADHYPAHHVISSDALRAMVGTGTSDLDASGDAFDVLEMIATSRLRRGLDTVIDTLGYDRDLRERLRSVALASSLPTVAVVFGTPDEVCRTRNRLRPVPVPSRALASQLSRRSEVVSAVQADGWEVVEAESADTVEPAHLTGSAAARHRQVRTPAMLDFHLVVSEFSWVRDWESDVAALAQQAESVGFGGIAVMDHLVQIPQVGRRWDPIPEAYATLAHIAAVTEHARLATLVTNVGLRHPALLAKTIATLDVLSAGRMECGLGAGWYEAEHQSLGIPFEETGGRMDLLEDTIEVLRTMWAPGAKPFTGRRVTVEEAVCYPRPAQARIPIIVGGGGERRTLRVVARAADGCNLPSDPAVLGHKLEVLRAHCTAADRPFEDILISVLDVALCATDRKSVEATIERLRGRTGADAYRRRVDAGTVDDQIGRYRMLAEMGVQRVYVSPVDLSGSESLEPWGRVVSAFR